jgi:hypothetical protein
LFQSFILKPWLGDLASRVDVVDAKGSSNIFELYLMNTRQLGWTGSLVHPRSSCLVFVREAPYVVEVVWLSPSGDEDNVEVDGHVKNDRYSWGEPLEAMPRLMVMSRSTKIPGARPLSRCRGRWWCRGRQRFRWWAPWAVVEVDDDVEVDKDSGGKPIEPLYPKLKCK